MCDQKSANRKDLTGLKFGRLTVVAFAGTKRGAGRVADAHWLCKCTCGNEKIHNGAHLRKKLVKSCGCLLRQKASKFFGHKLRPVADEYMDEFPDEI